MLSGNANQIEEAQEKQRLAAVRRYAIVDTEPEEPFDRVTRILSTLLEVPIAFVTFVEQERIWFKSTFGTDVNECERSGAFCATTIETDSVVVVKDATRDPRFNSNPFVIGPAGIRFYAGTPLRTPDGYNLGTLCVFDVRPRDLNSRQLQLLEDLAALVVDELELRRATQAALTEGERRFRDFANATSDWFWEMDEDLRFSYFSERMTQVVGVDSNALIGKRREDSGIENFADPTDYREHLEDLKAQRPFRHFVHGRPRENGEVRWFSLSGVPYFDELGRFKGYRGTGTDITQRVRAEESLRKADAQMRQGQKMEAVGQLTGGIAHDFNNLLGVIIGNLEILSEDLGGKAETKKLVAAALRAAVRGVDMTNRLLAFSRRQSLQPEACDLNGLISGMTEMLQRMLGETVTVRAELCEGLWPVEVDVSQFESALLNLAVNARQAMPSGGTLTIKTLNRELLCDGAQAGGSRDVGRFAELTVSDDGEGIPEAVLDRVFEPFFTTKDVGDGSGLGLSMVHGFVTQSGGEVSIESREGYGTCVTLTFPATEQSVAPTEAGKLVAERPKQAGESILIVEDDPDLRKLAVRTISRLGYRVVDVPDGPSALALLKGDQTVDLLFTDVVLPNGMDGAELVEHAQVLRPDLKVLCTSGYADRALDKSGDQRPAVDILAKPYRRAELASRLRQILEQTEKAAT